MPLRNIELVKRDFEESQWQDVIKDSGEKDCSKYSSDFFAKAREAEAAEAERMKEVFNLLGGLTSMMLTSDSTTEPFRPVMVMKNSRSTILEDFSDHQLAILKEIVGEIEDPEMRARVADVLWSRNRDFDAATIAIDSYLESATILEDPGNWSRGFKRIERAFRIAVLLGKKAGLIDKVFKYIEAVLDKYKGEDPLFLSAKLMSLLLEYRQGDFEKYASLSKKAAKRAESEGNFYKARTYWEMKAKWHEIEKNTKRRKAALKNAAETYIKDAEAALKREKPSHLIAGTHLTHAIEAYRRIGGEKERLEELHKKLIEYQKKSIDEMQEISSEVDAGDSTKRAVNHVKGSTLHEALLKLSQMIRSPEVSDLRKDVEEAAGKYVFQHIVTQVAVDEDGRIVGRMPSMMSNDAEEVEAAIRANMFKQADFYYATYAQTIIEPVRKQINLEHSATISDFLPIVSNNPLIPEGREYIYARGLLSGLEGDYLMAAHLVIPQLEHSMRHLLTSRGVVTSGLDSEGLQDERSLNATLYYPELKEILGEDIVFDLQGLLVERFGTNLRNRMAHGLMAHGEFYSYEVVYLWWLTLRLCCLPIIMHLKSQQKQSDETAEQKGN